MIEMFNKIIFKYVILLSNKIKFDNYFIDKIIIFI